MDPTLATGAAVAKAALESDTAKTTNGLVARVLGPTADVLGDALAEYTEFRLKNVANIARKATRKSKGNEGIIHPRVAHRIIEEGSYADDELMAEYLSGVLAASRGSADDRAVSWASLVSSMSSLQVRLHFLLYREWADLAHETGFRELGSGDGREQYRLEVDFDELSAILPAGWSELTHAMNGLLRLDLIDISSWEYGPLSETKAESLGVKWRNHLAVGMSLAGMELYAWAIGESDFEASMFWLLGEARFDEVDLPRMKSAFAPKLKQAADLAQLGNAALLKASGGPESEEVLD